MAAMITIDPSELNDLSSPLDLLLSRRSGKPRDMVAPGPNAEELETIFTIATRVPDHGKLAPWRFLLIDDRAAFAALLESSWRAERQQEPGRLELKANEDFAHQAPVLIAAIFSPKGESRIPVREQHLSMGAAIFNLELAATALGYVAGWLTGWAAYSPAVASGLRLTVGEQVAGFVFLGSPSTPLIERPRPTLGEIFARWPADSDHQQRPYHASDN